MKVSLSWLVLSSPIHRKRQFNRFSELNKMFESSIFGICPGRKSLECIIRRESWH